MLLEISSTLEVVVTVCGLVGGASGVIAILSIPSTLRKAKAEATQAESDARAAELSNMQKVSDGWKNLADERQEQNTAYEQRILELNQTIDKLYALNCEWRDKYNAKCEDITELKVYKATNEVKLCLRRSCAEREPQSGY